MVEDADWLPRALAGDEAAYRSLYERYAPMVHAILLCHAPRSDADDLLQEVFLSAWRGLSGLRDAQHPGGWLAAIARRAALRHRRKARPATVPLPEQLEDPRSGVDARRVEGDELLGVLHEMPEAYRESLSMRLIEGMSGAEIAQATGLSPASVRTHLSRGMQQLRERLHRKGWR